MIVEFTVGNFLSFKDKRSLNVEATTITEFKDRVFNVGKYRLLRSAVLYGANSSGKSNFIKAMSIMRKIIMTSANKSSVSKNDIIPFLLCNETEKEPSFFEVIFIIKGKRYRYGFEIDNNTVSAEWLFVKEEKEENYLFIREKDGISISELFAEGDGLEEKTRNNALFLSVVDQFNGSISGEIMKWLKNWVTISGLSHEDYRGVTYSLMEKEESRNKLIEFLNNLDLGFIEIKLKKEKFNPNHLPKDIPPELLQSLISDLSGKMLAKVNTTHRKFDKNGKQIGVRDFDLRDQESSGTNKVFDISGPVFDTLIDGGVLVIDELDAKLHPLMTVAITNLFNSPEINKNNAQLIFATHDTNLLSYGRFRRDQIFFVEKNHAEASDLYSLVEYKEGSTKIRKDRSFEKDYIQGRYGAIPFIGNFKQLLEDGK